MNITWTRQATRARDHLIADSFEYGITIARRAQRIAEYRAAEDGLNEATVTMADLAAARGLAGDEFLPEGK